MPNPHQDLDVPHELVVILSALRSKRYDAFRQGMVILDLGGREDIEWRSVRKVGDVFGGDDVRPSQVC